MDQKEEKESKKPLSSGGKYQSEWRPTAYYNPAEDGFCPVFPDPNEKRQALRFMKMKKEHIPACIAVEKDYLLHNEFMEVGVVDVWSEEYFLERLKEGKAENPDDDESVGFMAIAPFVSEDSQTEKKKEEEEKEEKKEESGEEKKGEEENEKEK
eukprot:CAMPEP_0201491800 /NCGR_PEP_ID=MMETSP0151_2-20130828/31292_1 /ASSEMBLY_ACC=CAM_ASM_000257 /TAXON_ID=200890 /ORGANISM="Paramoeba atlantica, Strain 621/1 / CCAP 1560/9" /LENGTH=153 /DNA_ID=CAMNT_0047878323 /DNA_START=42 /DNA_END=500 /DNA_ORIENTATION=-